MSYTSRVYRHRNAHTHENDNKNEQSSFFGNAEKQAQPAKGSSSFFQAKLSVNEPGDVYEREADKVANAIVNNKPGSASIQQKEISGIQRLATSAADETAGTDEERMKEDKDIQTKREIQRMCSDCEKEEKEKGAVQAKAESGGTTASPALASQLGQSAGKGNTLPGKTLNEMQSSFGADFSGVKIHTDAQSVQMNKEVGAQAFTHGSDIYFNAGKFNPDSSSGKHLLAHELTHVVQQGEGIHRKMGDGHDLQAVRFSGENVLEDTYDNEALVRRGSSGDHVVRIQSGLNDLGYSLPLYGADGMFGSETEDAVRSFQSDYGLSPDGVVGTDTMGTLDSIYTSSDVPPLPTCPGGTEAQAYGENGIPGFGSAGNDFPIPCQQLDDKPPCGCQNPPDKDQCSNKQFKKGVTKGDIITKAVKEAAKWLAPAADKMNEYITPPNGKTPNAKATVALHRHFDYNDLTKSTTTQDIPGSVKKVIDSTITNISDPFCGNCQDTCPAQGKDVFATSPGFWRRSNCFEFCEPFFTANLTKQAQIILHEMMHSWESKSDISYEVDGPPHYPPSVQTALGNADSYAALIRDLR